MRARQRLLHQRHEHPARARALGVAIGCAIFVLGACGDGNGGNGAGLRLPIRQNSVELASIDFAVPIGELGSAVVTLQGLLEQVSSVARQQQITYSRAEFREIMSSWRNELELDVDRHFRDALTRHARDGHDFIMRPVQGDQFPVRALYFRDDMFFLVDAVDQTHLLFRCRLGNEELLAAGTQSGWRVQVFLQDAADEEPMPIRVFGLDGFVHPERSNHLETEQVRGCLASFADRRHRLKRRFGDREKQNIQDVHDFFFEVQR